jgi:hypothetical protein
MDVSRSVTEFYKIWLAGGAVVLALAWGFLPRNISRQALAALVALSAFNYARWGPELLTTRLDAYDMLHYYVNAKYFDELGYLDLYPAVLLVDHEHDGPFFDEGTTYLAQDETGHHLQPISHAVDRGKVVRERFTPERWTQFEHDVLYLQRTIGCREKNRKGKCVREIDDELWRQLINDHGFNGTTVWTLLAKPFTLVPVEYIKLLGYLDIVMLGLAIASVWWAYGPVASGWTLLFLLVSYSTRWPTLSWAFLRYDWIALLIMSTALLRKGHPLIAGLLSGASATLRLFPAMWMWGPFAKGVAGLFQRQVHRSLLLLAAGFVLAALALQGAATLRFGVGAVESHIENMMDHNSAEQLSSRRIGLALTLATEPWRGTQVEPVLLPQRKARIDQQEPLRYATAFVLLIALGFAVRHKRDDEAYAVGFLPFFWITTASYYYYVARAPLFVLHGADLDRWRNRVGLAALFGLEMFCNWSETYHSGHRLFLIGTLAWGLFLYSLGLVFWLALEKEPTAE